MPGEGVAWFAMKRNTRRRFVSRHDDLMSGFSTASAFRQIDPIASGQLNEIAVSDPTTLEGLTQFRFRPARACQQTIGTTRHLRSNMREGRFCATLFQTARN